MAALIVPVAIGVAVTVIIVVFVAALMSAFDIVE